MTNKIILAAIALGLWANFAATMVRPAAAQPEGLGLIYQGLENVTQAINRLALKDCR